MREGEEWEGLFIVDHYGRASKSREAFGSFKAENANIAKRA
jgi:predicted TIM-barrel fold metal-dependent hydrolase